jgi:hypothetical protein
MSPPTPESTEPDSPPSEPNALETKLAEYARPALPVLTVGIALTAGFVQGPASAILVLAGGALVGVIAIFWASVRTLLGETPLSGADAYAIAAPRSEEEQKRAVLRALKDLEFERSVGKISEEDYRELVARYRGEAKRLLRLIDEEAGPRRERAAALVAKRLRSAGLSGPDTAYRDPAPAADGAAVNPAAAMSKPAKGKKNKKAREPAASAEPAVSAAPRDCAACGTTNDPDAVFCKKCGARQAAVAAPAAPDTTTASDANDAEEAS